MNLYNRFVFLLVALFAGVWSAAAQGETQKIKVACVGNSITYGTGIEDREHDSYPAQLQRSLGEGYEVGNFGRPGATLLSHGHRPYIEQPEYRDALDFGADIAIFHLGINDTDPRNWPHYQDEFVSDYVSLIDSFRKVNPRVRCIIARMTPIVHRHPRFISGTSQWHEKIQRAIETVAQVAGAELIDFHTPLYAFPGLFPDAIHPNVEGAGILAHTVYTAITGNYGGLKLSPLYTDYMVLQRNEPLLIHGTANAGETVTVRIAGQKHKGVADHQGKWQVELRPLRTATDLVLEVETPTVKRVFSHVAAGEVWLCSGQSNMEFLLQNAVDLSGRPDSRDNANLRLFNMQANWRTNAVEWAPSATDSVDHLLYYAPTEWTPCTPERAGGFSAIAYYFGQLLQDSLQVPVGLICNAVGGATTESWIDRHTLEMQFPAILNDWLHNDFIQQWARERAALNVKRSTARFKRHPYEPCYLFEAGILPLEEYSVKGVIWYQGESNAHNMEAHEQLFTLLVQSWRQNWKKPELPFYYVQLSSLNRPSWPWFRDSQRRLMEQLPHTGMAVSTDVGDSLDVHPRYKRPVGERLAHWALSTDYGCALLPSGPLFESAQVRGKRLTVSFRYGEGLHTADNAPLRCFEIAEVEGLYYPAQAVIRGNCIELTAPQVKRPRYVRYAWQPFTRANLVNGAGLPASTFRAEANR